MAERVRGELMKAARETILYLIKLSSEKWTGRDIMPAILRSHGDE